ncbi:nitrate reductase cytochrome c-type subunit [Pseudomonas sp. MM211]|uniref:nitrate reductase cytochrome c-type subunit n=1 Tax=Pseudomonas sp. MM211 TaxID=2866808 RepID=UPI001CEDDC71|nr:nitrate reductase cytochrome c-type subunit [Pseudomonas sp. MM211]UCJ16179.1 nitrate reductase cytochrome c-type subunit [Pseudomonas sp. MM211]
MKLRYLPLLLLAAFGVTLAADLNYPLDAPAPDGRRPGGTLTQEFQAPHIAAEENKDMRRERNYPEQPPTIPHTIVGYQVDRFGNRCLTCHSRANSASSQAPMISITHYMDRDGQPLAAMSPRRYFCTQCHVTQAEVKPLVENSFKNIDRLLQEEANPAGRH